MGGGGSLCKNVVYPQTDFYGTVTVTGRLPCRLSSLEVVFPVGHLPCRLSSILSKIIVKLSLNLVEP